jgi:hypothetical protein
VDIDLNDNHKLGGLIPKKTGVPQSRPSDRDIDNPRHVTQHNQSQPETTNSTIKESGNKPRHSKTRHSTYNAPPTVLSLKEITD